MRIILLGPVHPYRGGISDSNESLANALNKKGVKLTIVNYTLQYPAFLFPGKTQFREEEATFQLDNKRMLSTVNPWTWWETAAYIRKKKPDMVIFRYWMPFMAPALGSIAKLLGNSCVKIGLCDNVVSHEQRAFESYFTSYFFSGMDAFMTLSEFSAHQLRSLTKKKVESFPHPINDQWPAKVSRQEAATKLGLEPTQDYLLFFGLVRPYKGLNLTLEGLMKLKKRGGKLPKLIVAGEFYDKKENYLALINKWNLQDELIIKDYFIPKEEVPWYFSVADMLMQNYLSATQSGVTQVAYHYDCPVMVSDLEGLAEMVEDKKTGYIVPQNADKIADALEDFYQHHRKDVMAKEINTKKSQYTWAAFADALISLYKNH